MLVALCGGPAASAGLLEAGLGRLLRRSPASRLGPVGGARPMCLLLLRFFSGSPLQSTAVEASLCGSCSSVLLSGFDGGLEGRGGGHGGRGGVDSIASPAELVSTQVLEDQVVFFFYEGSAIVLDCGCLCFLERQCSNSSSHLVFYLPSAVLMQKKQSTNMKRKTRQGKALKKRAARSFMDVLHEGNLESLPPHVPTYLRAAVGPPSTSSRRHYCSVCGNSANYTCMRAATFNVYISNP
ncbi:hypothetical protein EJB05_49000, partial [Eragrostis curvula]